MDTGHNLIDLFNEYFEVSPADNPEKLRECFRLRYRVYCEEGLIPGFYPDDYPEGLEYDQYDERSRHYLLIHKPKKIIAGTVRIILAPREKPEVKFPLEKFAEDVFYTNSISFNNLPRQHIGEISRLILAPEFRARKGEERRPSGAPEDVDYSMQQDRRRQSNTALNGPDLRKKTPRRIFPHAILGLFVAIVRMSFEHNLTYWCSGMEPACARFLRFFGIDFKPISPIMDYYGPCKSYLGYIPDVMENIHQLNQQVWALLTDNGKYFSR